MKKSVLITLAAMFVFGLAIAVYAFQANNLTTAGDKTAACEKHKSGAHSAHQAGEKEAHCGMADCCKDGKCAMGGACCKSDDSCPLKAKQKTENEAASVDYSKITFTDNSGEDCCASGASCWWGRAPSWSPMVPRSASARASSAPRSTSTGEPFCTCGGSDRARALKGGWSGART